MTPFEETFLFLPQFYLPMKSADMVFWKMIEKNNSDNLDEAEVTMGLFSQKT